MGHSLFDGGSEKLSANKFGASYLERRCRRRLFSLVYFFIATSKLMDFRL